MVGLKAAETLRKQIYSASTEEEPEEAKACEQASVPAD